MKNIIWFLALQLAGALPAAFAQQAPLSPVYLTRYSFLPGEQAIGEVKVRKSKKIQKIQSITLAGTSAGAFRLDAGRRLIITDAQALQSTPAADVVLQIKTKRGTFTDTLRILKEQFLRNKVIAHRGAWKNTATAENSIAALRYAIEMGCEGSEFDVHQSADGVPVINHDADVAGVPIATTPAAQLLQIKLSNGEPLPTLEAYLAAGIQQYKTKLILEIKASALGKEGSIALARKVVELVEKARAQAWVDYISFDYDVCKEVMQQAPYAKVAYLNGDKTPAELAKDKFYGLDYHYATLQKNWGWIQEAKEKGLTVNVWTVNDGALMETLLKANVDFITTNEPERLLQMVSGKSAAAEKVLK